jgi:hypothetical protein
MNYLKIKNQFDSLTGSDQWFWAIENRGAIDITLDNDNTTFVFKEKNKEDDCHIFKFKADIGNRGGLKLLLKNLGFTIESS